MVSVYTRQVPNDISSDVLNSLYILLLEMVDLITDQKELFLSTHAYLKDCFIREDTDLFEG